MSKIVVLSSLVALSLLAGCGGAVEPQPEEHETTATAMTDEGLVLDEQRDDLVRGSFSRRAQTVRFVLRTDAGAHVAEITDANGAPLLSSKLRDGVEETVLLGTTTVRGTVGAEQPDTVAPHAFDAFNAHPAVAILPELKEALRVRGVAPEMFSANDSPTAPSTSIHVNKWADINSYWHLAYDEQQNFSTWAFWAYTTVELRPEYGYTAARLLALTGTATPEYSGVIYGPVFVRRMYWGVQLNVRNVASPLCNPNCTNTTLMARTY